jgi:hypothetical protein
MRALSCALAAGAILVRGCRPHLHLIWLAKDQLRRGAGWPSKGGAGAAAMTGELNNQKRKE